MRQIVGYALHDDNSNSKINTDARVPITGHAIDITYTMIIVIKAPMPEFLSQAMP